MSLEIVFVRGGMKLLGCGRSERKRNVSSDFKEVPIDALDRTCGEASSNSNPWPQTLGIGLESEKEVSGRPSFISRAPKYVARIGSFVL